MVKKHHWRIIEPWINRVAVATTIIGKFKNFFCDRRSVTDVFKICWLVI